MKGMEVGLMPPMAFTPEYTVSLAPAYSVSGTSTFCTAYWLNGNTLFPILLEAVPPRKSRIWYHS